MADNKTNNPGMQGGTSNQTLNQERAKAEVQGGRNQSETGQSDRNKEKSAIGGDDSRSQTGEPGRARNELDQDQGRKEPAGSSNQR